MENNRKFELIVSIVNRGYSDYVVSASRDAGATGGTIVFARGTNTNDQADSFMGISIQPEKDIVLILVKSEDRKRVMQAICDSTSALEKSGHGICFSMPVNHAVGIRSGKHKIELPKKAKKDKVSKKANLEKDENFSRTKEESAEVKSKKLEAGKEVKKEDKKIKTSKVDKNVLEKPVNKTSTKKNK